MSNIIIQQGIPVPPPGRRGPALPFAGMNVGDSFFVAGGEKVHRRVRASVSGHASASGGMKFVTRVLSENGVLGIRVWRAA